MATGQLEAADQALTMLAGLPPLPQTPPGQVGFAEAMRTLGAAFDIGRQNARMLNQRMVYDLAGNDAVQIERALRPRLPGSDQPLALTATLRALQGRPAEVQRLWSDDFSREQQRIDALPPSQRLAAVHEGAITAWHLGLALQQVGHGADAVQALRQANRMGREELRQFATTLDVRAVGFQQVMAIAGAVTWTALHSQRPADTEAAVAELLAGKGLPSRYLAERRRLLRDGRAPVVRQAREALARLEAELPTLETSGPAGLMQQVAWEHRYQQALAPAQPLLASAGLSAVIAEPADALHRVRAGLAADEALIGFAVLGVHRPGQAESDAPRVVRYTVTARQLSLWDLGPQRDLDTEVRGWRSQRDTPAAAAREARLGALLLRQLPDDVRRAERWVVDPDGLLALLPFDVLRGPDGSRVLERHTLTLVNHAVDRDAAADATAAAPSNAWHRANRSDGIDPARLTDLVVLADPLYDGRPLGATASGTSLAARDRAVRDAVPAPLLESRAEAEDIAAAGRRMGLRPVLLLGAEASPTRLTQVSRPAVLHIASHGALLSTEPLGDLASRERFRLLLPGQLAALVLSADAQGALFTAAQLEAMDLRGTRLVVLSACDTGNGAMDPHEGLASLRHAAELAGARATLTSLWPVPSSETARMMKYFYAGLADGRPLAEALRQAKQRLRQEGASTSAWAGFVLAGADR